MRRYTFDLLTPRTKTAWDKSAGKDRGGELNAAYLVAAEDVAEFRRAAAQVEAAPGVTVVCTGPWPPYSFAEGAR